MKKIFPILLCCIIISSISFAGNSDSTKKGYLGSKVTSESVNSYYYVNEISGGHSAYTAYKMDGTPYPLPLYPESNQFTDGATDDNGNWWTVGGSCLFKYSLNAPSFFLASNRNLNPSYKGIAYNPIDKRLYVMEQGVGLIEKYNPSTMQWDEDTYASGFGSNYRGLAIANDGSMYSVNVLTYCLCKFNHATNRFEDLFSLDNSPAFTIDIDRNISLEIDRATGKCYFLYTNMTTWQPTLVDVNLQDGTSTVVRTFDPGDEATGLAFFHGLAVTAPARQDGTEGVTLFANTVTPITWYCPDAHTLKMEYSITGLNGPWITVADNIPSTAPFYNLTVPSSASSDAYVRMTADDNSFVTGTSYRFVIYNPYPVVSPNGGENYLVGSEQTIRWNDGMGLGKRIAGNTNGGNIVNDRSFYDNVDLYYRTSDDGEWISIAKKVRSDFGVENSYKWTVPTTPSEQCKVKVQFNSYSGLLRINDDDEDFFSISEGNFTISQNVPLNGKYTLSYPNGGETIQGGKTTYITWRRTGIIPGTMQLEYSTDGGGSWTKINSIPIAGVMRYGWVAPRINSTKCLVRMLNGLTKVEYDRSDAMFAITSAAGALNYPNPFNPSTKIVFGLDKRAKVVLKVYNTLGQQVAELVNGHLEAGEHEYEFNGSNLSSGVYLYDLNVDGKSMINKMMLMK